MRRRSKLIGGCVQAAVLAAAVGLVPSVRAVEAPGHHGRFGDAGGFSNILPPGQQAARNAIDSLSAALGSPPSHSVDQRAMYDNLLRLVRG